MARNRGVRLAIALVAAALAGLPLASEAQPAAEADLSVVVDVPAPGPVGSLTSFQIDVTNAGPDVEPEAELDLTLPEGAVLASVEPGAGACDEGPPLTCSLGAIGPGESLGVTIEASPVDAGTLEGLAGVSGAVAVAGGEPDEAPIRIEAVGQPCTIEGDEGDDELEGTEGPDVICGLGGDDILRGLGGNDELLGGEGRDTADYSASPRAVRVDVTAGTAEGEGADTLVEIEHVTGSPHDDLLVGSGEANTLVGAGGHDLLRGGAGDDALRGGGGGDYLHGGPGTDAIDGGPGPDTCFVGGEGGTRAACEAAPNPADGRDARGPLELKRVLGPRGATRLTWTFKTRPRWTTRRMWDKGYLLVWIDARGGPEADHVAVIRSTGRRLLGRLFRVNAAGRERRVGNVKAWKRGRRGAAVRVAFHKVGAGPFRFSYRWRAQTMFTGLRCPRVCLDAAPGPAQMFLRPVPGT